MAFIKCVCVHNHIFPMVVRCSSLYNFYSFFLIFGLINRSKMVDVQEVMVVGLTVVLSSAGDAASGRQHPASHFFPLIHSGNTVLNIIYVWMWWPPERKSLLCICPIHTQCQCGGDDIPNMR